MHRRLPRVSALLFLLCSTAGCTSAGTPDATARPDYRADPREREAVGGTRAPAPGGSTAGPHEGERASTPPGRSRDELPPGGGTLRDPAGAVTRDAPPPGLR